MTTVQRVLVVAPPTGYATGVEDTKPLARRTQMFKADGQ